MYQAINENQIKRLADDAYIPADPANADYLAYLAWIAAGNIPAPAGPEPVHGPVASAYQIRQALSQQGLRQAAEDIIAAGDQALRDAWDHAPTFERGHPRIEQMRAALGLTVDQVDALFALAVTLAP